MFDYKKILSEDHFDDMELEVSQSEIDKCVDICGNRKGLLYLACRIIEFIEEDCAESDFAEMNLDAGIDLSGDSSSLCIFMAENEK